MQYARHVMCGIVKQVFTTMEFLGWYSIGDIPTEEDTNFHKQVSVIRLSNQQDYAVFKCWSTVLKTVPAIG